jgi:hypothetical protein
MDRPSWNEAAVSWTRNYTANFERNCSALLIGITGSFKEKGTYFHVYVTVISWGLYA